MNTIDEFSEKINSTISWLERINAGLDYIKSMASNAPQAPCILNEEETKELFEELENPYSIEGYVLNTYRLIADSCAEYSNYLTKNADLTEDQMISCSLPYIAAIYTRLSQYFDALAKMKWKLHSYDRYTVSFAFLTDLICAKENLDEVYSLDFLSDVSELWEIVLTITDMIHEADGISPFSDYINELSLQIEQSNEKSLELLGLESSPRQRKKTMKLLKKYVHSGAKKLSNKFAFEAYVIRNKIRGI